MSANTLLDLATDRAQFWPWTVDQYHQLIEAGFLPEGEPYELLDGMLVRKDRSAAGADPMTVSPNHVWAVKALAKLGSQFAGLACHIQTQQPITIPPSDEPEPDGAVVVGAEEDYGGRHPGADDVCCVIEVADSSLRRDRTAKMRIYANGGISHYFIINLQDRVVEAYSDPLVGQGSYRNSVTLTVRDSVELPAVQGKKLTVPVKQLLPA